MTAAIPEVVYVLPDKLGGVFNYVRNLLAHRSDDGWKYASVLTDNVSDPDTRSDEPLPCDRAERMAFELPPENIHSVLRRLARLIPHAPGVLVANDWLELALSAGYDSGRAVVAIAHGDFDFYYDLAARHERSIDAFVTYTRRIRDRLAERLPNRAESIHLLRYGVEIPSAPRAGDGSTLRLLYVGRLHRNKGVFHLPEIDAALRARGVRVKWTIQGAGPDGDELRKRWRDHSDVVFSGRKPMPEVLRLYQCHDVLVMPSRDEGLPVALLEAGAAGVVPVVSNLASGIPEVVTPGLTGYRPETGDVRSFADAIASIDADRPSLETMSHGIRKLVMERYDATRCAVEYQRLYHELISRRRPFRRQPLPYGSRLDQRWLPNSIVRVIRSAQSRAGAGR